MSSTSIRPHPRRPRPLRPGRRPGLRPRRLAGLSPRCGPAPAARPLAGVQLARGAPGDTAALAAAARGAAVVVQAPEPGLHAHGLARASVPRLTQAAIAISRELGATLDAAGQRLQLRRGACRPLLHEDTPQLPDHVQGPACASPASSRSARRRRTARMKAVVIRGGDFFGSGTRLLAGPGDGQGPAQRQVHLPRRRWMCRPPGPILPDMARSFVKRRREQRHRLPAFETLHFAGYQPHAGRTGLVRAHGIAREQGWVAPGAACAWVRCPGR